MAHELGHLELHDLGGIHKDHKFPIRRRDERSSQAVDEEEIEANSFATELLMSACPC
jgi:Zn-dependent peptidase ImmA (M78 family)